MAGAATEHAQVVVEVALSFLWGQLSIFAKLVGNGCEVSRGLRFRSEERRVGKECLE